MIRVILVRLLLFLLPFLLYALYAKMVKGWKVMDHATWRAAPMAWLFAIAFALVAASFVYLALTTGSDTDGTYIPARMEDGELVPGRIERD